MDQIKMNSAKPISVEKHSSLSRVFMQTIHSSIMNMCVKISPMSVQITLLKLTKNTTKGQSRTHLLFNCSFTDYIHKMNDLIQTMKPFVTKDILNRPFCLASNLLFSLSAAVYILDFSKLYKSAQFKRTSFKIPFDS